MHPLTVYGIETDEADLMRSLVVNSCMHPLTVYGIETHHELLVPCLGFALCCMHPLTVYGIETCSLPS